MADVIAFAKAVASLGQLFSLCKSPLNILFLLVAFRQTMFQIKPLLSAKTLAATMTTTRQTILLGLLTIFFGCQPSDPKTNNQPSLNIDQESMTTFKWDELADSTNFKVYYLQLNYLNFPDNNYSGKDILDFKDSISNRTHILNNQQQKDLLSLVSDSTNFSEGDCGTFHLNAGFIITKKDKIISTINIGCGFNQWNFSSPNPNSKYGSFNEKGYHQMEKLLDNINLSNRTNGSS